jgi:antitoxin Phd
VVITKHNAPRAVLLSYPEFEALTASATPALDDLSDRFDELLASMQTPQAKAGVAAAFDATPEELGAAAVKAARTAKRRR